MIHTSYFANIRNLPDYIEPISIALRPPKGYSGWGYKKLYPPPDVLEKYKRDKNEADYTIAYKERVLERLDPVTVVRELYALVSKPNIALVCYEKPDEFCHRHLVADYLTENGFECLEWEEMS